MATDYASAHREIRLNTILADYFDAVETGQLEDRETLLERHPDLAAELSAFFSEQEHVFELAQPLRSLIGAGNSIHSRFQEEHWAEIRLEVLASAPTLDDYDLLELISAGGMGVVYKARQKSLNRLVALKMVRSSVLASANDLRRFQNEAEAIAALDHPAIVPVYEVGQQDGSPYFTMKWMEGGSLDRRLSKYGSQPKVAARLVADTARAVHHAHQRGILHRDLKPSNILLDGEGRPHIADFGLVKWLNLDSNLTQTGLLVGTPNYMAPEQAVSAGRETLTTGADVYGLGAILYALLTGKPPFAGTHVLDTLDQVRHCEPAAPRSINSHVDRDLESICLKCLEKDPAKRYDSAEELARDLERWQEGKPVHARPVRRVDRAWRWCKRNRLVTGLSAILVAILTLAAAGLLASNISLWNEKEATRKALMLANERDRVNRLNLYVAHISQARRLWDNRAPAQVLALLDQDIPSEGDEDLRSFEWFYLWHLCHGTSQARRILRGHEDEVYCVNFSPDGKLLATTSKDKTARFWDTNTWEQKVILRGHTDEVNWAAFSPDGRMVATSSDDGSVGLWDVATGANLGYLIQGTVHVFGLAFSPDGKELAAGLDNGILRRWTIPELLELRPLNPGVSKIGFLAYSPDGRLLAVSGQTIVLLDRKTEKPEMWDTAGPGNNGALAFSHHNGLLAAPQLTSVRIWDLAAHKERVRIFGHGTECLAFSPNDNMLAIAGADGFAEVRDPRNGAMRNLITGHADLSWKGGISRTNRVWSVAFSPNGRTLATSGADGTVQLWDPEARPDRVVLDHEPSVAPLGELPRSLRNSLAAQDPKLEITSWTRNSDGSLYAVGTNDHIVLRSAGDGQRASFLLGHKRRIASLSFSPDGRTLASGADDGTVRLWNVATGQELYTLIDDADSVNSVAFEPDGNGLVTCITKGSVKQTVMWLSQRRER
jgi:WD40 repeat protein/tRNA A-37 threonylcarbamoyl transferase component Bud32